LFRPVSWQRGRQGSLLTARRRSRMPEKTRSTESEHLAAEGWPSLPLQEWDDTRATLHLWTQIVGKIRLAQAPLINHWWQVPLYVTARGLTTTATLYRDSYFPIDLDFI